MKVFRIIPYIIAVSLGVLIALLLIVYQPGTLKAETAADREDLTEVNPETFEWLAKIYMTDTSILYNFNALDTKAGNFKHFLIWYETSSDVWANQGVAYTVTDSDSDGYRDWIAFTATSGATAGGECWIYAIKPADMGI